MTVGSGCIKKIGQLELKLTICTHRVHISSDVDGFCFFNDFFNILFHENAMRYYVIITVFDIKVP
jgi:hypothetical protein